MIKIQDNDSRVTIRSCYFSKMKVSSAVKTVLIWKSNTYSHINILFYVLNIGFLVMAYLYLVTHSFTPLREYNFLNASLYILESLMLVNHIYIVLSSPVDSYIHLHCDHIYHINIHLGNVLETLHYFISI